MRRRVHTLSWLVGVIVLAWAVPAMAAAVGAGMLKAKDTGLAVVSAPHRSTLIAVDLVEADSCEPGAVEERAARVVAFAGDGAQLNEVVFDLGSAGAAKALFADFRANELRRAECSTTEKATNVEFHEGPKKVGSARFTVTSDEKIAGEAQAVTAVRFLKGSQIVALVFIGWNDDLPTVSKVARRAADRLA